VYFKPLLLTALVAVLVVSPLVANAGSSTATVSVTATISANCTIAASPLQFGSYDPLSANNSTALTAATTINVTCTKGSTPSVAIGGNGTAQMLLNGTDTTNALNYDYTLTPPATITLGINSPNAYTLSGSVNGGQDASVGSYSGSLVATVNF
jgi:spore coat protein U-like protein